MVSPYRKKKVDGRTVYEHRAIVERRLGRKLGRYEFVHHDNEIKKDNRPDNLVGPMTPRDHARHHMLVHPVQKECAICGATFEPPPSHRPRDRTCSGPCKAALISLSRLGRRAENLNIVDIRAAVETGESRRSAGRRYGVSHACIGRIIAMSPALAAAVARKINAGTGSILVAKPTTVDADAAALGQEEHDVRTDDRAAHEDDAAVAT